MAALKMEFGSTGGVQLSGIAGQGPRRIGQAQDVEQIDLLERINSGEGALAADEIAVLGRTVPSAPASASDCASFAVPWPSQ